MSWKMIFFVNGKIAGKQFPLPKIFLASYAVRRRASSDFTDQMAKTAMPT
jgi:hypothetical protein